MANLLIVDDERVIADGLQNFFENESEISLHVEKAYSAREALKIMERMKIDVVVTDICMPGIDGIELHRRIRLQWPKCRVIYLTGHNDFTYVRSAIQQDSVAFFAIPRNAKADRHSGGSRPLCYLVGVISVTGSECPQCWCNRSHPDCYR